MISIKHDEGKFIFNDFKDIEQIALDVLDLYSNHFKISSKRKMQIGNEILTLKDLVKQQLIFLNDGSLLSMIHNLVLLIVYKKLMQKPCNFQFLYVGEWTKLCECLSSILLMCGEKNHLYVLTKNIPSKDISNVTFISLPLDDDLLPPSRFSMIFIDSLMFADISVIPSNLFFALKDCGDLIFITNPNKFVKSLKDRSEIFLLDENMALISFNVNSQIKNEIHKQSNQYQVSSQKKKIIDSICNLSRVIHKFKFFSDEERKNILDEIILSVSQSEIIINDIYEELNSKFIKPSFNELKESLIDYRLYDEENYYLNVLDKYKIVLNEMIAYDDFDLKEEI